VISGIELIIQWLTPLGEVGPTRGPGAALPFRMVQRVAGSDDKVVDSGVYQVDTFAATFEAAESEARRTHERMLQLGPPFAPQQRVTLSTGVKVFVDSVSTSQSPTWLQFTEAAPISRFVARYSVDIRLPRIYLPGS
jgi:hypothetical protein